MRAFRQTPICHGRTAFRQVKQSLIVSLEKYLNSHPKEKKITNDADGKDEVKTWLVVVVAMVKVSIVWKNKTVSMTDRKLRLKQALE